VAIWVHFALSAEAMPVISALFMVLLIITTPPELTWIIIIITTPPELTWMAVFVAGIKTPTPTHG